MKTKSGGRSLFRKLLAAVLLLPGPAHALSNGVPEALDGTQGTILVFSLDVPAGMSSVTFGATAGYGDADIYVNFGEPFFGGTDPNPVAECVLLEGAQVEETCEVLNPAAGLWMVQVIGVTEFEQFGLIGIAATALTDGQPLAITGTNPVYYIDVPQGQKLFTVSTTGGTGASALQAKLGLFGPFLCSYGYDESYGVCRFYGPVAGRWYVLVPGSQFSGASLLAQYAPAGSAVGSETALSNAVQQTLDGAQNSIQTFYLDVPAGVSFVSFSVGAGAGADFFVNYNEPYLTGADPTVECASLSAFSDPLDGPQYCQILNPAAGRWYVEVYGATAFSDVGLFGIAATALQNGEALTIAGTMGSRAAYYIDVPSGSGQLTVGTSGGTGNPDLHLGYNAECHSTNSGTVESCQVNSPGGVRWYVVVEGVTEYSGVTLLATYAAPVVPPFTFVDAIGAEPEAIVESNVITVATFYSLPISVTGGEYRIGNAVNVGNYISSAGHVGYGQTVQVRATAGPFGQTVNVVLNIGGVEETFSVTSRAANADTVLDAQGQIVAVSTNNGTLVNLAQATTPAFAPSGYQYDHGFFAFDITDLTPGDSATVTMTLAPGAAPSHYVKCTASACALFGGATFAGRVVTLTLVDGGAGDADNLANGTISDPGAPAYLPLSDPPDDPSDPPYDPPSGGGGGAMDWLSLGLLLAARRRRPWVVIALAALLLPVPGWADTTPAQFSFPAYTDAEPGQIFVNGLVVTEIDEPTPISVTDGEYRIGGGAFTTSPSVVHDTQQIQVRATAGVFGETVNLVLDIGGVQGTLSVTSRQANTDTLCLDNGWDDCDLVPVSTSAGTLLNLAQVLPPAFASPGYFYYFSFFAFEITGLAPGDPANVTVPLPAWASPHHYVTCDASACALSNASIVDNVITLNLVDGGAGDEDGLANGTISVLGAPAWNPPPPHAFAFTDVSGVDPGAIVQSNVITVAGTNHVRSVSVTSGEYRIGSGAYVSSAGTVTSGQTVQVRATAGPFGQAVNVVLNIGGVQDTFSVTTRTANADTVLDAHSRSVAVSTNNGMLMDLAQAATPAFAPSGYAYYHGFFAFDITNLTPGATAIVTMTLPVGFAPSHYVKCTASACALFGGATFADRVVTLTLVDGGAGDADNLADGTISDPGAPATVPGASYSSGGGGAMDWLSLGLLLAARRRLRGRSAPAP